MPENTASYIPMEESQLDRYKEKANLLLSKVVWIPRSDLSGKKQEDSQQWRSSSVRTAAADELSLMRFAKVLSKDPLLLTESVNHVMTVFRRALCIGMHVSALYTKFSGLETLISLNAKGGLSQSQKTEFREKYETASAVTVFSAACYMIWELSNYRAEEVSGIQTDFRGIPEVNLTSPVRALDCMCFYYGAYLDRSGEVNTDADCIKMTLLYFQGMVDEIRNREASLKYADLFTSKAYKLTGSDFCLNGFEVLTAGLSASVEFNRVELGQIVGNRDAKHKARRLVERLMCYDRETKRNPMHDMGGLPTVRMGHGEPGTGKSLQIAATATMLHDHCRELEIPFLFRPMPDNLISTFQGGSAERAMDWMKPMRDPGKIIYAPVDDAENNLEDRNRQGISAGVREVVGVFLRNTEGAYAVNHGNSVIELFTNLPEQLDKAVLSRIRDRFYIGGAMNHEDFLDQDYLWWRRYREMDPNFTRMKDPENYEYLSAQKPVASIAHTYEAADKPKEERIRSIFDRVAGKYDSTGHDFFAAFYEEVKKEYPFFTSRDLRNIQSAVTERIMDFDLDPSWMENQELFFRKDYDTKKNMILELMKSNMKGLSFAEIRLQESIRYLDSLSKIVFAEDERKLEELVTQMRLREKAEMRFAEKNM